MLNLNSEVTGNALLKKTSWFGHWQHHWFHELMLIWVKSQVQTGKLEQKMARSCKMLQPPNKSPLANFLHPSGLSHKDKKWNNLDSNVKISVIILGEMSHEKPKNNPRADLSNMLSRLAWKSYRLRLLFCCMFAVLERIPSNHVSTLSWPDCSTGKCKNSLRKVNKSWFFLTVKCKHFQRKDPKAVDWTAWCSCINKLWPLKCQRNIWPP
jgi:hypothetical protein